MKKIVIFLAFSLSVMLASAQSSLRPVSSTWELEVGAAQLADTYLTPLKYNGFHIALGYQRAQAMKFCPERWVNALRLRFGFDRAKNPAGNSIMYSADVSFGWSMLYGWKLPYDIRLKVGGAADADIGALLLARNSNNPAQARASVTVGPEVTAYWTHKIWGVSAHLRSPLIGAFFSPDYGELYYEISLGNRRGLVHCAWPGAYRRLIADLFFDVRPGSTALRIGYRADLLSFRANGITGRSLTHSAVIAVNCDFLSVNPRKYHEVQIITADY